MGKVTTIIFDKDGTLFDFQTSWGDWAAATLHRLSGNDPARAEAMANALEFDLGATQFLPTSRAIAGTIEDIAEVLWPHLSEPMTEAALARHLSESAAIATMREAVPLADYFQALAARDLKIGLVTNDNEATARRHLDTIGIAGAFGFIAGYDSGYGAKPAPGQIEAAVAALGSAPGATVMVGDSLHDLIAGRAAGVRTVGVLTGVAGEAELQPFADAVFPDIGHIPAWLDTL